MQGVTRHARSRGEKSGAAAMSGRLAGLVSGVERELGVREQL